jgi:hypothetical protein
VPDLTPPLRALREVIEDHRAVRNVDDPDVSCSCGAEALSDHSDHLAERILDRLGLKPETVNDAKRQIRYATAWFDWELTKFEGAQP